MDFGIWMRWISQSSNVSGPLLSFPTLQIIPIKAISSAQQVIANLPGTKLFFGSFSDLYTIPKKSVCDTPFFQKLFYENIV